MKELTEQEKYDLAKKLDEVQGVLYAVTELDVPEDLIDALDDAIELISPKYVEDCVNEIEEAINDPEAQAFAEKLMNTPEAKAFFEEMEARENGKIIDINSRKGRKDSGKN